MLFVAIIIDISVSIVLLLQTKSRVSLLLRIKGGELNNKSTECVIINWNILRVISSFSRKARIVVMANSHP